MSNTDNRLNVFPSRMVLTALKERVQAARTGHSLLKRKSDAIKANLNLILKDIMVLKRKLFRETLRDANFSHTDAAYYAGKFNAQVIENTTTASFRIKTGIKNIAGVKLPDFSRADESLYMTPAEASSSGGSGSGGAQSRTVVGLSAGGREVAKCKDQFFAALTSLVRLATLQTALKTLDDALKITNRRVNALEFVVLPTLENTIAYVLSELDELEREDQYRIKKVKDLRMRDAAIEAEARRRENKRRVKLGLPQLGGGGSSGSSGGGDSGPPSALSMSPDAGSGDGANGAADITVNPTLNVTDIVDTTE